MTTELDTRRQLLDVLTGEVLEATPASAARVIVAAREMKSRIQDVIRDATDYLREQSMREGTKTFETANGKVTLGGGETVEYDVHDLREALTAADCPEDRITDAIKEEISYKVDRSVLRQLAAANPDYKAAIDLAERRVEKPYTASVR